MESSPSSAGSDAPSYREILCSAPPPPAHRLPPAPSSPAALPSPPRPRRYPRSEVVRVTHGVEDAHDNGWEVARGRRRPRPQHRPRRPRPGAVDTTQRRATPPLGDECPRCLGHGHPRSECRRCRFFDHTAWNCTAPRSASPSAAPAAKRPRLSPQSSSGASASSVAGPSQPALSRPRSPTPVPSPARTPSPTCAELRRHGIARNLRDVRPSLAPPRRRGLLHAPHPSRGGC